MRYLSVCSGIEAASAAWHGHLPGWSPLAFCEFDAFPSAVLAHHYPGVPNLGDLTRWHEWDRAMLADVDLLVGGTPCQSFSVAGLRRGLEDDRGNLMLQFVELANAIDDLRRDHGREPCWVLWENVPGVFSDKTNGFGALLGGLGGSDAAVPPPPRAGWPSAGVAAGPQRVVAWRTLDAQYFGVAQRRRRVFVLALGGARGWSAADALLPVGEGVRADSAPRREARERVAGPIAGCSNGGGANGPGRTADDADSLIPEVAGTLGTSSGDWSRDEPGASVLVFDTTQITSASNYSQPAPGDPSHPLAAGAHPPAIAFSCKDYGGDVGALAPTLRSMNEGAGNANAGGQVAVVVSESGEVASTLRTCGNDHADIYNAVGFNWQNAGGHDNANEGLGITIEGTGPLQRCQTPAVAFESRYYTRGNKTGGAPSDTVQLSATGAAKAGDAAPCVAFAQNQRDEVREVGVADALAAEPGMKQQTHIAAPSMQVRRLTPRECERLQGFPDDYTLVPYRGKPAADGPRYKALGNSMAVPVMRWIGRRIAAVKAMSEAA